MPKYFNIQAGPGAIAHIKRQGLSFEDISVMPAAAGGPKWIVLYALDKYLMTHWFQDRKNPLHLIGASAGAWRMLCYALTNSSDAMDRFLKAYVEQRYETKPSPTEVSNNVVNIVKHIISDDTSGLMTEQLMKLFVISTETIFPQKADSSYKASFGKIALRNLVSRKLMHSQVNRIIFTNSSERLIKEDGFNSKYIPFTNENLISGLQSTGTLPLYMDPVTTVPEVEGMIWDGALIDYQMGLEYEVDGLVLYPHFSDHLIEGWFDKFVPWRKTRPSVRDKMIMISPSQNFIQSLPDGKIPDREDFDTYFDNNDKRIRNWYEVAKRGEDIAEELDSLLTTGTLIDHIKEF